MSLPRFIEIGIKAAEMRSRNITVPFRDPTDLVIGRIGDLRAARSLDAQIDIMDEVIRENERLAIGPCKVSWPDDGTYQRFVEETGWNVWP